MNSEIVIDKNARLKRLAKNTIAFLLEIGVSFGKDDPRYVELQTILLKGGLTSEEFDLADAEARNEHAETRKIQEKIISGDFPLAFLN